MLASQNKLGSAPASIFLEEIEENWYHLFLTVGQKSPVKPSEPVFSVFLFWKVIDY